MPSRRTIGNYGEKLAARYLIKNGFTILDANFSGRFGEIDIIAKKEGIIHFIEVKTRTNNYCGTPEEGLTKLKISRLLKTCKLYVFAKKIPNCSYQLDLIAIEIDKQAKRAKIRHYRAVQ